MAQPVPHKSRLRASFSFDSDGKLLVELTLMSHGRELVHRVVPFVAEDLLTLATHRHLCDLAAVDGVRAGVFDAPAPPPDHPPIDEGAHVGAVLTERVQPPREPPAEAEPESQPEGLEPESSETPTEPEDSLEGEPWPDVERAAEPAEAEPESEPQVDAEPSDSEAEEAPSSEVEPSAELEPGDDVPYSP